MTVAEWDWVFDDTLLADIGTEITEVDGLGDLPDMESGDSPKTGVDGEWSGQDFARGRTVTLTMDTVASSDADITTNLSALNALFTKSKADQKVLQYRPGGDVAKRVYARTRKRSQPLDYTRITRLVQTVVQLRAADPRIYADDGSTGATLVGSSGTGTSWPVSWPLSWGGASSSGAIDAQNDGDADAPWTATLAGPLTNPYLVCGDSRLSFTGDLAEGDFLTLDQDNKSVFLNGTSSRYEWLDVGAEWFELAPGTSHVDFGADSGDGTLTLYWRSTWL